MCACAVVTSQGQKKNRCLIQKEKLLSFVCSLFSMFFYVLFWPSFYTPISDAQCALLISNHLVIYIVKIINYIVKKRCSVGSRVKIEPNLQIMNVFVLEILDRKCSITHSN